MRMTQRIDRDPGGEIEVALTLFGDQPDALAPLESEVDARIGRQEMRGHAEVLSSNSFAEMKRAAPLDGTKIILFPAFG
jgi:hypothetical protein